MRLKPQKYGRYNVDISGNTGDASYSFVNNLSTETKNEFGLIAQEVYTIPELRDLVTVPIDSDISAIANTTIYDGSLNEPDGYYEAQGWGVKQPAGLNYQGFIPLLIKGFQEQQAVITQQQATITQQQTTITQQQATITQQQATITQQQATINNILQQLSNSNTYDEFKNSLNSVNVSGN